MATGTTVTCVCGSRGFIVVHAVTGEPIDLKTLYAAEQQRPIDPNDLKRHNPLDLSNFRTVCANPNCRRPL
jgi:hypothetical protein